MLVNPRNVINRASVRKTAVLLVGFFTGIVFTVQGDGASDGYSSVSAVTTHAANNGGFSQPPITVTAHEAAANSTIADSIAGRAKSSSDRGTAIVVPNGPGVMPPLYPDDSSFPGYPSPDTNAVPETANDGPDVTVTTNSNSSASTFISNVNADGDITNANGTMTYDTCKPNWWVKTE